MLSGCGQLVSEKLTVAKSGSASSCPTGKKLVILPLADYSYVDDADKAFHRNVMIMENLSDRLTENGFRLPVQEDFLKYLADQKIIKIDSGMPPAASRQIGTIQHEMYSPDWSTVMKEELAKIASFETMAMTEADKSSNYALDSKTLAKIAGDHNADLIMRGRIIKYRLDEENTWHPIKKGLLPVLFDGSSRALFGVTNSDTYDTFNSVATGAMVAAGLGGTASSPYDETEKINPTRFNSVSWGIGGAALGYLASKGGHANQAAVELRLWVQDPLSGDVLWTNRVEVMVKPQTIFAETREDKLFKTAVNQAVTALVKDFVTQAKAVL